MSNQYNPHGHQQQNQAQQPQAFNTGVAPRPMNVSAAPTRTRAPTTTGAWLRQGLGLGALATSEQIYKQYDRTEIETHQKKEADDLQAEKDAEALEAMNEWADMSETPLGIDSEELTLKLGRGFSRYFTFLKALMFYNVILTLCALISMIPHMLERAGSDNLSFPEFLYLSDYQPDSFVPWVISNTFALICMLLVGGCYRSYVVRLQSRDRDGYVEDPFQGNYNMETEGCVDKIQYPPGSSCAANGRPKYREARLTASLSVFVGILILQGYLTAILQQGLDSTGDETTALILALFIKGVAIVFKFICQKLTVLEGHAYISQFRQWECFKVFTFKICNVLVLYFVTRKTAFGDPNENNCQLEAMSYQFIYLLIMDIAVNSAIGVMLPIFMQKLKAGSAQTSDKANSASLPQFILSDDYTEAAYRQFIISLGFWVAPVLPLIGVFGFLVEYWLDKYRLLRLVQKPNRTGASFKEVLAFFLFIVFLASFFAYPNGAVWVMAGSNGLAKSGCTVFQTNAYLKSLGQNSTSLYYDYYY